MIDLPVNVKERIERCVAGDEGNHLHWDDLAREHGAIGLFGTIGLIWCLRPDGTFWQIDNDFGLPTEPLPKELETCAIVYGVERYPWLGELLPIRPVAATACSVCDGRGRFSITVGIVLCSACRGLGWVA